MRAIKAAARVRDEKNLGKRGMEVLPGDDQEIEMESETDFLGFP
jgi:hypothetical protein